MVCDNSLTCNFNDSYQELWPYGKNQILYCQTLCGRFLALKSVLQSHLNFFNTVKEIHKVSNLKYSKTSAFASQQGDKIGSMATALTQPLALYAEKCAEQHAEFLDLLNSSTVKQINLLQKQVSKKHGIYKSTLEKFYKELSVERVRAVDAICSHETVLAKRPYLDEFSGSYVFRSDPWLSEQKLGAQLELMIQQENSFEHKMQSVVQDMIAFDRETLCGLVKIWQDFTKQKAAHWSAETPTEEFAALEPFLTHEFNNSFSDYVLLHETLFPATARVPHISGTAVSSAQQLSQVAQHKLQDFPYKPATVAVVAVDVVYRRGTVRKTQWKPALLLLTKTGFLHMFALPKAAVNYYLETRTLPSSLAEATDTELHLESNLVHKKPLWSLFLGRPGVTLHIESLFGGKPTDAAMVQLSTVDIALCALPNGPSFGDLLPTDNATLTNENKSLVQKLHRSFSLSNSIKRAFKRRQKKDGGRLYDFKTIDLDSRGNWFSLLQEMINESRSSVSSISTSLKSLKPITVHNADKLIDQQAHNADDLTDQQAQNVTSNALNAVLLQESKDNNNDDDKPHSCVSANSRETSIAKDSISINRYSVDSTGTSNFPSEQSDKIESDSEIDSTQRYKIKVEPPKIIDYSPAYKNFINSQNQTHSQITLDDNDTNVDFHDLNTRYAQESM